MESEKPRIIAFYLPQYHPTPDNDKWWGKGFTEWTNVGKARPLFKGHYQPRVPADLGYYDLRLPQVREQQAALAAEAGIYGFCYYHYWFGNGKRELELPFDEVLRSGEPDFPFCLCWANETWHTKFWNKDGSVIKRPLVKQEYPGDEDTANHFESLLPAFSDKRYIRIDGKPLFMIYKPFDYKQVDRFIAQWNDMARRHGMKGIHFVAHINKDITRATVRRLLDMGFDAVNTVGLWEARTADKTGRIRHSLHKLGTFLFGIPNAYRYEKLYGKFLSDTDSAAEVYPTLIPNWDHTPRSGRAGYLLTGSTPELFGKHARQALDTVMRKDPHDRVAFLKSWNEWGEGNYMEPDLKFGKGYIEALRREIEKTTR